MLPAIVLSHLANGELAEAWTTGVEFVKVLLYYFLLVGVVDTPARLETAPRCRWRASRRRSRPWRCCTTTGSSHVPAIEFLETGVDEARARRRTCSAGWGARGCSRTPTTCA